MWRHTAAMLLAPAMRWWRLAFLHRPRGGPAAVWWELHTGWRWLLFLCREHRDLVDGARTLTGLLPG